eukprot:3648678-Prymnesium_polylepis.2
MQAKPQSTRPRVQTTAIRVDRSSSAKGRSSGRRRRYDARRGEAHRDGELGALALLGALPVGRPVDERVVDKGFEQ